MNYKNIPCGILGSALESRALDSIVLERPPHTKLANLATFWKIEFLTPLGGLLSPLYIGIPLMSSSLCNIYALYFVNFYTLYFVYLFYYNALHNDRFKQINISSLYLVCLELYSLR